MENIGTAFAFSVGSGAIERRSMSSNLSFKHNRCCDDGRAWIGIDIILSL